MRILVPARIRMATLGSVTRCVAAETWLTSDVGRWTPSERQIGPATDGAAKALERGGGRMPPKSSLWKPVDRTERIASGLAATG